jgi:hypothetical protein
MISSTCGNRPSPSDNISGEEIQVINTHMHRYVEANSLQSITDYLDGVFDTQLFRSLCVDIARFLPSRYVPDKRTMQVNRDRLERKQLLQVFGEPNYDSPLLSASTTEQKRKASSASTKDRSDKKRVKSVKKASCARKRKPLLILNRTRQVLLTRRPRVRHAKHSNPHQDPFRQSQERILVRLTAALAERKDTILVIALAAPKESLFFLKTNHFDHSWLSKLSRRLRHKPRFESWTLTTSLSVTIA